ncbi:rmlC-like jelly roll fold protein [Artemisia annua]|uniref:RmlC-like jelly roll fold protein n=1 Tax=Artemisia annua TaxID=35608 RepID=A0A2U1KZB6_ARTAN|nr:rmlC-like jelly roll fold protein [Artemisia annua]
MASLKFYVPNQTPQLASLKPTTKHCSISLPTSLFCKPTTKHSSISGVHYNKARRNQGIIRASSETMSTTIEKLGIKIVKNPPEEKLTGLGVRSWPKWGCPPSKFPWTYSSKETCFLLKGKVKVTPEGSDEAVEFGAGDLVEFPSGMSCTWDVSETVDKHYKFE